MSDSTPKAVTNDPELSTGDFSDTSVQPPAPGSVSTDTLTSEEAPSASADLAEDPDAAAVPETKAADELAGLSANHPEHLEPFWVPLAYRKAQRRDTVIFGISAIVGILAGAAALLYFNPFGGTLTGPSWIGPTAAVLAIVGILGVLVFGIMALFDLSRSERAYFASTHGWLKERYGLDLSKHKVKALSKHRTLIGGVTGWKKINLEGYPQGVQITYTERYGYRLISTVDNVESQLPRSAH